MDNLPHTVTDLESDRVLSDSLGSAAEHLGKSGAEEYLYGHVASDSHPAGHSWDVPPEAHEYGSYAVDNLVEPYTAAYGSYSKQYINQNIEGLDFTIHIPSFRVFEKTASELGSGLKGYTWSDYDYVVVLAGMDPDANLEVRLHEFKHRCLPVPHRYDESYVRESIKLALGDKTAYH